MRLKTLALTLLAMVTAAALTPSSASASDNRAWTATTSVSCATASIAGYTVSGNKLTVTGTVTPCASVPPGAYFAFATWVKQPLPFAQIQARVLYDGSSPTYFQVPVTASTTIDTGVCLLSFYNAPKACYLLHGTGSTFTVTPIATNDPAVTGTIYDPPSRLVDTAPKCGTCW